MTKNVKDQVRTPKNTRIEHPLIPQKYQHLAAIIVIYISLLVFFHSIIFDGKTYQSVDTIASHSWETLYKDAKEQGIFPLWNPFIFCGMPGYASLTFGVLRTFDFTTVIWEEGVKKVLAYLFFNDSSGPGIWLLYYLVYGIGMYLFAFQKFKNKPVAIIVSLMAIYATYVALLIMIGHVTKLAVLAWFPYIFLLVDKLREKFHILWALILTIVLRLLLEPTHVQFIFYIYLSLGFYLLFFFIRALRKKENWRNALVIWATLICTSIFAFFMGADQYFSTLEYNPYSIRGANPIVQTSSAPQTKTIEGGLDYDYATSWSFDPGEIMTFFVPSWYGFGPHNYQGPLTQNQEIKLNTYFGPQPFVDGPQYMGVVVIVLALIGFFKNRKEPFVQYMGFMIVVSLLIAFGKEFPLIYDAMYRYFPMFNKFRVPLMILILVQFFTPILAGYGIISFIKERNKTITSVQEKRWKYILGLLGFGIVISLAGGGIIKNLYSSFFSIQDIEKALSRSYGQLNPTVIGMFYDIIVSSVITDMLVGFILLLVVFGAFYYYQKGKIKSAPLYGLLVVVVLFDLWRVAWKPSDPKNRKETIQTMATPDFVKVLERDTTQFRVLKMIDGQPVYDNTLAYWRIQNAYGYHGAKMRSYQDMVDVAGLGNPLVWQIMNIKYLVTNRNESNPGLIQVYDSPETKLYAFRSWLPRTFFVNRYEVSDSLSTLKKIAAMTFNPMDIAYLSKSITTNIDPPLKGAEAKIVHYGIQDIEMHATATGNNLLFLSETYYPKGWKAFIDGNETEIYRLNYLFRGIIIPQGSHTLIMKFEPASFSLGKTMSLLSNILVWGTGISIVSFRLLSQSKKKQV